MNAPERSYRWLEELLELLFDRYDRGGALTLLRDLDARQQAIDQMTGTLQRVGMPDGMLQTSEGANLFVAVLALRLKFPRDEAREKVRLNIATREGRA